MKIFVAIEQHFVQYQDSIYTDIAFAYRYWKEYLEVFDEVCPIARIRNVNVLPEGFQKADGPNVCFIPVTEYLGFWDFLRKIFRVLFDCYKATRSRGCYLLRLGNISTVCWIWLFLQRRPYAFEAIGHAGKPIKMLRNIQIFGLARVIAFVNHNLTKIQAKFASGCSYTSRYLQGLYPSMNKKNEWVFSSVKLNSQVITHARTKEQFQNVPFHIVSIGRLEPEKGHAIFVDALGKLNNIETNFTAKIIGPGKELENLRNQVLKLGLEGKVEVSPAIPWGEQLFEELDKAQLYILPSLSEGMPRSMIEAMARGLPAIGSNVGGIKELLNIKYLVPPSDDRALAEKIGQVIKHPETLVDMSKINFEKAIEYRLEIMNRHKNNFWNYIKTHVY